ncbi:MAG: hypothetical protein LBT18_04800 [Endomicrobium sp.]|jgi:LPS-assembly protein|nr:hypothetical protein [Endomicrobium sp.]
MNKSLFKKIIAYVVVLLSTLNAFAYEVDIASDNLEYDEKSGKINAKGNVILDWQEKKVYADYVDFIIGEKNMHAYGNVKVEESGNAIYADSVTYNYDKESGSIKETFGYSSFVFMRAKSMEKQGKDTYALNSIKLSSCDLDKPHTHFRAKRGKLILNKRITLYFPFFYVGKIPIFPLPFVTKSLEGGRSFFSDTQIEIEPGWINDGDIKIFDYHLHISPILKTKISFPLSKSSTAKLKYDYLGPRGNGYGGEFDYVTRNARGSIYAYTINDLIDKKEKWSIMPNYWQRINNKWTIRSKAELMNDNKFNDRFSHGDWDRVKNTLESYASISRQGRNINLEMLVRDQKQYVNVNEKYEISSLTLPQVTLTSYSKNIFFGITHNFVFTYSDDYKKYSQDKFYKNTSQFDYNLQRRFRLGRKFTLKPALTLTENWQDKDNAGKADSSFVTRCTSSLNSRFMVTSWMNWNVNYSLKLRSKANCLSIEDSAKDYGYETNQTTFASNMYVGDRTQITNRFLYSCKKERSEKSENNKKRWSPFYTEITWSPKYYITVYIQQSQLLDPFRFNSCQIDLRIGEPRSKIYFNFGAFYQRYNDTKMSYKNDEINNVFGFGMWITPKWRFDYDIKTMISRDLSHSRMNEHEFKLYRDLHCYNLGMIWKIRNPNESEVYFKFDMKTNMPFDRKKENIDYEDPEVVFYPWRDDFL